MRNQNNTYRQSIPLPGPWFFQIDQDRIGEREEWFRDPQAATQWGTIHVPGAWNCEIPTLWTYEGIAWYATLIPGFLFKSGSVNRLLFQRVSFSVKAWLDGKYLGEHYGGDLPFVLETGIEEENREEHLLVLRVDNETQAELPPGSQTIERVIYGGLLKEVLLETLPEVMIDEVIISATPRSEWAWIECSIQVVNHSIENFIGSVVVKTPGGTAAQAGVRLGPGKSTRLRFDLDAAGLQLWSPSLPQLYTLTAQLLEYSEEVVDEVQDRFGVRSIQTLGNAIMLNGESLTLRGVNRYDEFAGVGPVASREQMRQDLLEIKASGANFIRTHYPQDPDLLDLMDEIGFLVMEEVFINWWAAPWLNEGVKQEITATTLAVEGEKMLENMIRRDMNHPCIIAWSMLNESGTHTEVGNRTVLNMLRLAKRLDPGRLATFVAAGDPRVHPGFAEADIVAFNCYPGVFGDGIAYHRSEFEDKVAQPLRELLIGAAEYFRGKPLVVTEFGCHAIRGLHGDNRFSEDYQAAYLKIVWDVIRDATGVQGGVVWCWADYYHRRTFMGTGLNAEFGPFGLVTVDRKAKKALETLHEMYHG